MNTAPPSTAPAIPVVGRPDLGPRYRLTERLGEGGSGLVWRAYDRQRKREVALKLLRGPATSVDTGGPGALALARFRREFGAVGRLDHPGCVKVLDYEVYDGRHFFTMDYVPGGSFRERLKGPPGQLVPLALQVLAALDYVHAQGLVHRDIKPENILVAELDDHVLRAQLVDFGLARVSDDANSQRDWTRGDIAVGTLPYLAPEVADGGEADPRSDLFAFGVVLYEVLSGRLPFALADGETQFAFLRKVRDEPAPPLINLRPDLPTELVQVIHRMLAKSPDERYATAYEVFVALKATLPLLGPQPDIPAIPLSDTSELTGGSYLVQPAFVNREDELLRLETALSDAWSGRGQMPLLLIAGETGVGKSRLLREFARRALGLGATLFTADMRDAQGGMLNPWRQVLESLLAQIRRRAARRDSSLTQPGDILEGRRELLRQLLTDFDERAAVDTSPRTGPRLQVPAQDSGSETGPVTGPVTSPRTAPLPIPPTGPWESPEETDPRINPADTLPPNYTMPVATLRGIASEMGGPASEDTGPNNGSGPGIHWRMLGELVGLFLDFARDAPSLLCLEDLHNADAVSLKLLGMLCRSRAGESMLEGPDALPPPRVLIIGTYRGEAVNEGHPLAELRNDLRSVGLYSELNLEPLDASASRRLVANMLSTSEADDELRDFSSAVNRRAEGNPLFIEGILKALLDEGRLLRRGTRWALEELSESALGMPSTLRELTARRLLELPAETLDLLEVGAVVGRSFEIITILEAGPWDDWTALAHLDRGVRHGIIVEAQEADGRYLFLHDRLREALLERIPRGRRMALHRAVAVSLERQEPRPDADLLAYHFLEAGIRDKAVRYLIAAGDVALRSFAGEQALAYFERASLLSRHEGSAIHVASPVDLQERLGDAYSLCGRYALSVRAYELALAPGISERARIRRVAKLAEAQGRSGHLDVASDRYEEALTLLQAPHAKAPLARAWILLRGVLSTGWQLLLRRKPRPRPPADSVQGDHADWVRLCARIYPRLTEAWYYRDVSRSLALHFLGLHMAESLGRSAELALHWAHHGYALQLWPWAARRERYIEAGLAMSQEAQDQLMQVRALTLLGHRYTFRGRITRALRTHQRGQQLLERVADPYEADLSCFGMLLCNLALGRFDDAELVLQRQGRIVEQAPGVRMVGGGHIMRGMLHAATGAYEAAIERAEAGLSLLEGTGDMLRIHRGHALIGRALLSSEQPLEAVQALEKAQSLRRSARLFSPELDTSALLIEAHLESALYARFREGPRSQGYRKHLRRARRLVRDARWVADRVALSRPRFLRVMGVLAWLSGSEKGAHQYWRQALAISKEMELPIDEAWGLIWRGRMLASQPAGLTPMRADLEDALALLQSSGAQGEARRVERMLR